MHEQQLPTSSMSPFMLTSMLMRIGCYQTPSAAATATAAAATACC